MQIVTTIAELRLHLDAARTVGRTVGLVPTMGYLHEGHESLMVRARAECDEVVATIFVNPLQFAPNEDLDAYPRDLEGDTALATRAGVDWLFVPSVEEMYPRPVATTVSVAGVSSAMEGASRPTHFDGVATVVAKLFNIVGPCHAYFGEKDFQQVAVVRRMAAEIATQSFGTLDYVEVADTDTLQPQQVCGPNSRLVGAVRFGRARLIDNVGIAPVSQRSEGVH